MTIESNKTQALPETNRSVAEMLYILEVGLRELIISVLSPIGGAKWHVTQLPKDVSNKYLRGRSAEQNTDWMTHVHHHPLYYIDFPDLSKVLRNKSKDFEDIFSERDKEVFISGLRTLEPIRNKLAHNRRISPAECKIVSGVLQLFESTIGRKKLTALIERSNSVPLISDHLRSLLDEIQRVLATIESLEAAENLTCWHHIKNEWWFDSAYLTATHSESKLEAAESRLAEANKAVATAEDEIQKLRQHIPGDQTSKIDNVLDPVEKVFAIFEEYASIPRTRGRGHQLEEWSVNHDVVTAVNDAKAAIMKILNGISNE